MKETTVSGITTVLLVALQYYCNSTYHEPIHESQPPDALRWWRHGNGCTLFRFDVDCPWSCPTRPTKSLQTKTERESLFGQSFSHHISKTLHFKHALYTVFGNSLE